MPASPSDIRKLISKIGKDAQLIDALLKEGDETKRKKILVGKGLLKQTDAPTRDEVMNEIKKLITPAGSGLSPGPSGRVVEWVGAVATAAAGAAAAVCTGD